MERSGPFCYPVHSKPPLTHWVRSCPTPASGPRGDVHNDTNFTTNDRIDAYTARRHGGGVTMCGIIGRVGDGDALGDLLDGLENLEYRGYDSAGVAVHDDADIAVAKHEGEISDLRETLEQTALPGQTGIGHTRWSTHGEPNDANAHPHTGCTDRVAVVHNGIIENYGDLRDELRAAGHEFTSETDSEVVPHLIETLLGDGNDPREAFRQAIDRLEGSYALAAVVEGEDTIFATRQDSPLVIGVDDDGRYLASDVPAFLDNTNQVVYIEDGDVVELRDAEHRIWRSGDGGRVDRPVETVDWDAEETAKGQFDHYMQKEIFVQPDALGDTLTGRFDQETGDVTFEGIDDGHFADASRVRFVACGTSYHAAMYGASLLTAAGVDAAACRASEFTPQHAAADDTLVVAVTQSGETADTLNAMRAAASSGLDTLAVTNVVGSTAAREADDTIYIRAGPEIGVAATKTFSSQAVTLALLTERIADDVPDAESAYDRSDLLDSLADLPDDLETVLYRNKIQELVWEYEDADAYFFIGAGLGQAVAREGALKFKEITYEHAEGFAAGELKHGPLALVTPDTPVFAVLTGEDDDRTLKNASEAAARGAPVITIGPGSSEDLNVGTEHLDVPETHPITAGLLANVHLQLIAYHTADLLGRSIDKPRNLAKSVTVE